MNKTPTHHPRTSAQHPGQVQIRGNEGANTDELLIAVIADSSPYYGQGSNGAPFISLQISQVRAGVRNEALDCEIYALHAARASKVHLKKRRATSLVGRRCRRLLRRWPVIT